MDNQRIATTFESVASLLAQQDASPHRVRAWREGAAGIRGHAREMSEVFRDHGRAGLEAVPHIGPRLANVIIELVKTGHCGALDRLRGDPVRVLERVPGLGPCLAQRIHRELGIETLEDLEAAAHDGRLASVAGLGARRREIVRDVLATRLHRSPDQPSGPRPPVDLVLEIDRAYRAAAAADTLTRITPRRFNPHRRAWLPILHLDREGWAFTAMYSNTALAHQLGRTHDWVIVHFHEPEQPDRQTTVVTEHRGPLRGCRVVRGREAECEADYARGGGVAGALCAEARASQRAS